MLFSAYLLLNLIQATSVLVTKNVCEEGREQHNLSPMLNSPTSLSMTTTYPLCLIGIPPLHITYSLAFLYTSENYLNSSSKDQCRGKIYSNYVVAFITEFMTLAFMQWKLKGTSLVFGSIYQTSLGIFKHIIIINVLKYSGKYPDWRWNDLAVSWIFNSTKT